MIVAGVSERHCIAYVTVLSFLTYRSAFGFTGIPVPSGLSQQQFLRTAFAARSPSSPQHIYSNVQQDQVLPCWGPSVIRMRVLLI